MDSVAYHAEKPDYGPAKPIGEHADSKGTEPPKGPDRDVLTHPRSLFPAKGMSQGSRVVGFSECYWIATATGVLNLRHETQQRE
jgi:hypothetical protein